MLQLVPESLIRFDDIKPSIITLADSGHARVLLVCLKKGQMLGDHKSASQISAWFLRGKGTFYADGHPAEAGPGCLILLEANRFHRIHAEEDCVVLVTMTPHPARDRYPQDQIDRIVSRAGGQPGGS